MNDDVYVVIAAYNEESKIAGVVNSVKKQKFSNIIIVDDGSIDRTSSMAIKAGAIVLTHKKNKGQGAALRTGIRDAVKRGAHIIVTFDADGQHKPGEIKRIIQPIREGLVDVALGSRFLGRKQKMRFIIRFLLWLGIIEHLLLYGVMLTDVHNGFRALSRKAAKKIKITCDRMEHASEIIEEIGKKKLSYMEVPVTIKYTKYSAEKGQSPGDRVKVGIRLLKRRILG